MSRSLSSARSCTTRRRWCQWHPCKRPRPPRRDARRSFRRRARTEETGGNGCRGGKGVEGGSTGDEDVMRFPPSHNKAALTTFSEQQLRRSRTISFHSRCLLRSTFSSSFFIPSSASSWLPSSSHSLPTSPSAAISTSSVSKPVFVLCSSSSSKSPHRRNQPRRFSTRSPEADR
jgi:hypothetical protein